MITTVAQSTMASGCSPAVRSRGPGDGFNQGPRRGESSCAWRRRAAPYELLVATPGRSAGTTRQRMSVLACSVDRAICISALRRFTKIIGGLKPVQRPTRPDAAREPAGRPGPGRRRDRRNLHEHALRRSEILAEQLQTALDNRVIIEQALGVLAERTGLPIPDVFTRLPGLRPQKQNADQRARPRHHRGLHDPRCPAPARQKT